MDLNHRLTSPAWAVAVVVAFMTSCGPTPPEPLPEGAFSFGVFGDGPYFLWEEGRFNRVLKDADAAGAEWLIHVGDILYYPCSDAEYHERLDELNGVSFPVVYTPGDNEWTDCHEDRTGQYDPLERLESLRQIFFADPARSLGGRKIDLRSQASDSLYSDFPENARWRHGGVVFATLHVVGSENGMDPFRGREARHDQAVERRTSAAIAWMDQAFSDARADSAWGVVLALHADIGLSPEDKRDHYDPFVSALKEQVAVFPGQVLLIHGDNHELTIDHPLTDETGQVYENFTRLETFGSPDIGWVRVVVDSVNAEIASIEPRKMWGWW